MVFSEKTTSEDHNLYTSAKKDRMPRYSYYFSDCSTMISSVKYAMSVDNDKSRNVSPNFGAPGLHESRNQFENTGDDFKRKIDIKTATIPSYSDEENISNDNGDDICKLDREDELVYASIRNDYVSDNRPNVKTNNRFDGSNELEVDSNKIDRWCQKYANGNMEIFRKIQMEKMAEIERNLDYKGDCNRSELLDELDIKIVYNKGKTASIDKFDPSLLKPGDILINRYLIVSVLSSSTFSTVVKAVDQTSNFDVSIKISMPDYVNQTIDEIILLKRLDCKGVDDMNHIVKLIDFFFYNGCIFMVTELLGNNLYEIYNLYKENKTKILKNLVTGEPDSIKRKSGWTLNELRVIARDLLKALNHLHTYGIINCDIKPENVLLKIQDPSKENSLGVKMIDFGSSCYIQDKLNSYVQSRSYRAPEVVLGLPYDTQIDLWSLGCTLCEVYMGRVLFPSDNSASLVASMISLLGVPPVYMLQHKMNSMFIILPNGDVADLDVPKHVLNIAPKYLNIDTSSLCANISESRSSKSSHATAKKVENSALDSDNRFEKGMRPYSDSDYVPNADKQDINDTRILSYNNSGLYENFSMNGNAGDTGFVDHSYGYNIRLDMGYDREYVAKRMRIIHPFRTSIDIMFESDTSKDLLIFTDFIKGLLQYDPIDRMTAKDALSHPFITNLSK